MTLSLQFWGVFSSSVESIWIWIRGLNGTTIASIVLLGLIIAFYWQRWYRMTLLQRCGIPGPKPYLITGNMKECFSLPNVVFDTQLTERYGPVCGYYLGAKPIILISDPDILKKIEIEQAKNFRSRPRRVPGGINPDPRRTQMLGNLPPEQWNETRKVLSKAFTPSKLKEMVPQIKAKIGIFMDKIKEGELDFYPLFQALTLDIIGQTGFGVECDIQQNIDDPLHIAVQSEFAKSPSSFLIKSYLCFTEFTWLLQPFRVGLYQLQEIMGLSESSELWDTGFRTFHERIENNTRRPDILQQLLDSHLSANPLRVVANSVLFFEAAYETLSSSMAFIIHLLVKEGQVQDRVRDELAEVLREKGKHIEDQVLEQSDLPKLKYLEMVIKEALRLFPPQTTFIGRSGDKAITVQVNGKKMVIPPGVHVQAGLYQLHHSPEHWDDPEEFRPERFLDPNVASSSGKWQAFGLGPRICIGQSFAWIVLKFVLGNLFAKYELQSGPNSESEITIRYKIATMTPAKGSFAVVKKAPIPQYEE